jgi:hypothetical protein
MKGRSTTDAIFVARGIVAHGLKVEDKQLFQCFIDLKKAYDVVNREALWEILSRFGLPEKIIKVI